MLDDHDRRAGLVRRPADRRPMASDKARRILAAHRVEAPVDFTVKSDPDVWAEQLRRHRAADRRRARREAAANVSELPGFAEGEWWVQDAAAACPRGCSATSPARASPTFAPRPAARRRSWCWRARMSPPSMRRRTGWRGWRAISSGCGSRPSIVQADILTSSRMQLFDAVLLDAPCSSTGTVRRHPDVPWTKSPADIEKLAALQARLLAAAVESGEARRPHRLLQLLARSGSKARTLYSRLSGTASGNVEHEPIRPGEIAGVDAFLTGQGHACAPRRPTCSSASPAVSGLDGFFAAVSGASPERARTDINRAYYLHLKFTLV